MTASSDDDDDIEDQRAKPHRPASLNNSEKIGLLDRVRSNLPMLFPGPPPDDLPQQVQILLALRNNRLRRFLIRSFVFVILPTLAVWFYTSFLVTPRYVCNFEETYQVYQPTTTISGGLVQSAVGSSVTDSVDFGTIIYQYIKSEALAMKLDKQIDLRAHFSDSKIDWTSRLARNASNEAYFAYYSNRVSVSEGFGGYVTVSVQGFDPAYTLLLAQTVNADAGDMLDGMTAVAREDDVKKAEDQMNSAANALQVANNELTEFRNKNGDLDPSFIATQLGTIIGTLESQLATLRAQLAQAQANLQPNSSQVVQLKLQVSAMEKQIDLERQRLSDNAGQSTYSNTVAVYDTLVSNQQLATTNYESAQQGLVIAQTNAARKTNYVVDFVPPVLPDHPTEPSPATSTLTAFLACLFIYGIFNLLFTAFRDQSGL